MTAAQTQAPNGHKTDTIPAETAAAEEAVYDFLSQQSGHVAPKNEPDYPFIQWMNGNKMMKGQGGIQYTGGFIVKTDTAPDFPVGELMEWVFQSGKTDEVMALDKALIVPIAERLDWFFEEKGRDGKKRPRFLKKYEAGARGRNRWLVFVKGAYEWHLEHGPLMLSLSNTNGVRFAKELFPQFNRMCRDLAKQLNKPQFDDYTFWRPICPDDFEEVGKEDKSWITPPKLMLPNDGSSLLDLMKRLYVGDDMMSLCAEWWDDAQEWATTPMNEAPGESGRDDLADYAERNMGAEANYGSPGNGYGSSGSDEQGPRQNLDSPPFDDTDYDEIPF